MAQLRADQIITIRPDLHQYRGLLHALNTLPKKANHQLKTDVASISLWTATQMRGAAMGAPFPKQAAVVARTIKPQRDRVPSVTIGGAKYRTSGGAWAGNLLYGNEFGAKTFFPNGGRRFPYRSPQVGRGNEGYWIFPTLRRIQPEITRRWKHAVDAILKEWGRG
jgi:hypothetical protein